jgi:hypothetical protein
MQKIKLDIQKFARDPNEEEEPTTLTYTRKIWANGISGGTPITADDLNNIENGVYNVTQLANTLQELLNIQTISAEQITTVQSEITKYSFCIKFNNIMFVSLTIGSITMASGNKILVTMPYKPKSDSTPLIANMYRVNNEQQVCYIDSNGNIHVNFNTAVSNGEVRIVGFYEIKDEE